MINNKSKRIVFLQDDNGRAIGYTTLGKYSELKNAIGSGGIGGNPILISQPSYAKPTTRSSKPCCGKRRK